MMFKATIVFFALSTIAAAPPTESVRKVTKTAGQRLAKECLSSPRIRAKDLILKIKPFQTEARWSKVAKQLEQDLQKRLKGKVKVSAEKATHLLHGRLMVINEKTKDGEVWTFLFNAEVVSIETDEKIWVGTHQERLLISN